MNEVHDVVIAVCIVRIPPLFFTTQVSFLATIACLAKTQHNIMKLSAVRSYVFGFLLWLLPVKFNSFSNMAQSRPDFPDAPLFCLRTLENLALGAGASAKRTMALQCI